MRLLTPQNARAAAPLCSAPAAGIAATTSVASHLFHVGDRLHGMHTTATRNIAARTNNTHCSVYCICARPSASECEAKACLLADFAFQIPPAAAF